MNFETVHYFNLILGIGAIIIQALSLVAIGLLLFGPKENKFLNFIKVNFIPIGFFLASAPWLVLVYSEIAGFIPCQHCWVQRIFMFPQVILFGVAWLRKDRNVLWYSLPLLMLGLVDAIYLNYLYYFSSFDAPCDASGASCVKQYVNEFGGYISIPMLSLTAFFALITIILVSHFYKKDD